MPYSVNKRIGHLVAGQAFTVTKEETSLKGKLISGCPQGGVLSPLPWNSMVGELLKEIERQRNKVVAYVDDLIIMVRGTFLVNLMEFNQRIPKVVKNWCSKAGLLVNLKKSDHSLHETL